MSTKDQFKKSIAANRVKAEQWQKEVRKRLNSMLGVGSRHTLPGGNPMGRGMTTDQRNALAERGGMNFQHGVTPSDTQVAQYIQQLGGNPYIQKVQESQQGLQSLKASKTGASPAIARQVNKTMSPSPSPAGIAPVSAGAREQAKMNKKLRESEKEKSKLDQFLEDAQAKYDEANAANESRYQDILGRLESSRERNLERVENYGIAAAGDLEERAAEALGSIRANQSARGLGNSTIFDAFKQRNARDLAREQQRLSEQVDNRTAMYDQRLTGDIAGFMERRTDQAPDYGQIASLAQQYGLSNEGQGFGNAPTYQPQEAAPVEPVPSQAAAPVEAAPAVVPNYPTSRASDPNAAAPQMAAAPQVPQPDPQYQYQQPPRARGFSPRQAQRMAKSWQQQLPQYNTGGAQGMLPSLGLWGNTRAPATQKPQQERSLEDVYADRNKDAMSLTAAQWFARYG